LKIYENYDLAKDGGNVIDVTQKTKDAFSVGNKKQNNNAGSSDTIGPVKEDGTF
jgi:hypothetical protein